MSRRTIISNAGYELAGSAHLGLHFRIFLIDDSYKFRKVPLCVYAEDIDDFVKFRNITLKVAQTGVNANCQIVITRIARRYLINNYKITEATVQDITNHIFYNGTDKQKKLFLEGRGI